MRRRIGSLCVALGALLLLAAIALAAYNRWDDWRAGNEVSYVQMTLEMTLEAAPLLTSEYGALQDEGMATVEIDGYSYIGTLSISRYGLELPVMSEWSYAGLKIAPGRYSGTVLTDDLVICGHNYERHFGNLKNLEAGDEISFTDLNGNTYDYEVEEVLILQPTDVEEMLDQEEEEWDLTLFTCTSSGQARVTVRCVRAKR